MVEGAFYGHALAGVRVLKIDGAFTPRVLRFDSGFAAEGSGGRLRRQYDKTDLVGQCAGGLVS